jgi:hypothetical protein
MRANSHRRGDTLQSNGSFTAIKRDPLVPYARQLVSERIGVGDRCRSPCRQAAIKIAIDGVG